MMAADTAAVRSSAVMPGFSCLDVTQWKQLLVGGLNAELDLVIPTSESTEMLRVDPSVST